MNRKSSMIKKKAPTFDTVMPFYVFLMKKTGRHDPDLGDLTPVSGDMTFG